MSYDDLLGKLGQELYKELYHLDGTNQCVAMDIGTRKMYLKKELDVYNLEVFAYLKTHKNTHIANVDNYWMDGSQLIVIEEYIQGSSLEELLKERELTAQEKEMLLNQVFDAMLFLHQANPPIIHRDLKPSNIMVSSDWIVKVIDYDAAKVMHKDEDKDTVLIGTAGIAAPEQYGFGQSDQRTDIYALGVLLQRLYPHDTNISKVIKKATQIDPKNRYKNISAMRDAYANAINPKNEDIGKIGIPGFRSHNIWKSIIAIVGYAVILYHSLTVKFTHGDTNIPATGLPLWIFRICGIILSLAVVDLFTDWTHIYRKVPWINDKNWLKRIIAYALTVVLLLCTFGIVTTLLMELAGG